MQWCHNITFVLRVVVVAVLLLVETASTQPAERRVALVIGNGQYQHVPRLANPANDAQLIAETLTGAGFTLVGGKVQLDLDKMAFDRLVQAFGTTIPGAEVALFYYAGHGLQVRGANYLVPVSANPTKEADVDFQLVQTDLVLRQMELAGTRLNLVILDACRNNPFAGRGLRAAGGGLAQMQVPEGTLISYATQPGNVAQDGTDGHSPYTKALASAFRKPGLDLFAVFNETGLEVKKRTGGAQQPWVSSSPIAGQFYFAGAPTQTSTGQMPSPKGAKPPESSPPAPPSVTPPPVHTAQGSARDVDHPLSLEAFVTREVTLDANGAAYFVAPLPAGDFKIVVDTRKVDRTSGNLQSDLSLTDPDGVILKQNVMTFNAIEAGWRQTYDFSLHKPTQLGLKLRNTLNTVAFWLTILTLEPRAKDATEDAPEVVTLTEDDLTSFAPKKAHLLPFPFFGRQMPRLLRPDQRQSGFLDKDESAYYIIALPTGKYKAMVDFTNAQGDKTNIQGYLAFLHPDGGGQKEVLRFNEVDTSARKSAGFELKKPSVLIARIGNMIHSVNYAVRIRPDQE
jgi:hypothetical protein